VPALTQEELLDRIDPKHALRRKDLIDWLRKRRDHFQSLAGISATQGRYDFAHKWQIRAHTYDALIYEISYLHDQGTDPEREDELTCPVPTT
jgi:hypothetical protein